MCRDTIEIPRYKCHKGVWALKIAKLEPSLGNRPAEQNGETDGGFIITPAEEGYAPFKVDHDYHLKHRPHVGGYYVVYKDGYESFSPAEAFEEGYSALWLTTSDRFVYEKLTDELIYKFIEYQYRLENPMPLATETKESMVGKYKNDALFQARVRNLVNGVFEIVRKYIPNNAK